MDRSSLIWFVEIRMSAPRGPMTDHPASSRIKIKAHVANAGRVTVS
jgi:hypothetical protein